MKKVLSFILSLGFLFVVDAYAAVPLSRQADSTALFKDARVEVLRPGVVWTSTVTFWKGEPRSLNVVTISSSQLQGLEFAYPEILTKTSVQCEAVDALVGINGQFFNGDGTAVDFLKIDGKVLAEGADGRSATFASGVFVFDDTGADVRKVDANEGARHLPDANVMCCGPILLENGECTTLNMESSFNTTPHPRTAIGVTSDGRVILATIDGRFPGQAIGMSTPLMQEYMTLLGAHSALNLDGGGSTTLYIKGYGVVNHACDGLNWDAPNERKVSSIIYLK